jgi:hypothetical protein
VELTAAQVDELRELIYCPDVAATVGTRARIVLWFAENRPKKEIAAMAGVSRPTVNLWLARFADEGVAGLLERKRGAGREQVPGQIRARILAATRSLSPRNRPQRKMTMSVPEMPDIPKASDWFGCK